MNLKISIISPLVALALGACGLPTKNPGETNTDTAGDSTTAAGTEGGSDDTAGESTAGESTDGEPTDGESTAADPGTTGTTAEPGETGTTDMSGDETGTTEENPGQEDFDAMGQCELPVVCEPVTQKFAEGEPYQGEEDFPGMQCVWAGLRDGTAGRYTWITGDHFGNGDETRTNLIHVHADRKVTFAVEYDFDIEPGEESWSGFEPAKTCTLAEPAFFDDCLQNLGPGSGDFDCAWAKVWWVDCVEDGPKCE